MRGAAHLRACLRLPSDERVGRREAMGNSLGRALFEGSDTSATTGRTDGKLWEIALGRERGCRDDRVDGRESVRNSLGRAPLGGSGTSETTGWTDGKPWEIA